METMTKGMFYCFMFLTGICFGYAFMFKLDHDYARAGTASFLALFVLCWVVWRIEKHGKPE